MLKFKRYKTVSMANEAWRIEQNEEGIKEDGPSFIGALDLCFHSVFGEEIISLKPRQRAHWFWRRPDRVNCAHNKQGGIWFTEKDCGKKFKWIFGPKAEPAITD